MEGIFRPCFWFPVLRLMVFSRVSDVGDFFSRFGLLSVFWATILCGYYAL